VTVTSEITSEQPKSRKNETIYKRVAKESDFKVKITDFQNWIGFCFWCHELTN